MIKENLENVRRRIEAACRRSARDTGSVRLVAVTKEAEVGQIIEALNLGVTEIGENRVKNALFKKDLLDGHIFTLHMIGHLQSNKAGQAVRLFSVIHSVDSLKLAFTIDREAKKAGKTQDILVEVNVSGEESKFGIRPEELDKFLEDAGRLKHLSVKGLMTMAPFNEEAEKARPYFRRLKELASSRALAELSMGMTQDFEVAVEEGATMVRVGRAIFGGKK